MYMIIRLCVVGLLGIMAPFRLTFLTGCILTFGLFALLVTPTTDVFYGRSKKLRWGALLDSVLFALIALPVGWAPGKMTTYPFSDVTMILMMGPFFVGIVYSLFAFRMLRSKSNVRTL